MSLDKKLWKSLTVLCTTVNKSASKSTALKPNSCDSIPETLNVIYNRRGTNRRTGEHFAFSELSCVLSVIFLYANSAGFYLKNPPARPQQRQYMAQNTNRPIGTVDFRTEFGEDWPYPPIRQRIAKEALDWSLQGARRAGRQRHTWTRSGRSRSRSTQLQSGLSKMLMRLRWLNVYISLRGLSKYISELLLIKDYRISWTTECLELLKR